MADLWRFGDADGEIALGDSHSADAHIGAHHDGAAGFIDHHLGGGIRRHAQILKLGQRVHHIAPGEIGHGVHNLIVNLSEPNAFINDVLQGRFKRAAVPAGWDGVLRMESK